MKMFTLYVEVCGSPLIVLVKEWKMNKPIPTKTHRLNSMAAEANAIIDREITRTAAWLLAMDPQIAVFWRPDQKTEFTNIHHLPLQASGLNHRQLVQASEIACNANVMLKKLKDGGRQVWFMAAICGELSYLCTRDSTTNSINMIIPGVDESLPAPLQPHSLKWEQLEAETRKRLTTELFWRGN